VWYQRVPKAGGNTDYSSHHGKLWRDPEGELERPTVPLISTLTTVNYESIIGFIVRYGMLRKLDSYVEDAVHYGARSVNEVVKFVKQCVNELESHEEKQVRSYALHLIDDLESSQPSIIRNI